MDIRSKLKLWPGSGSPASAPPADHDMLASFGTPAGMGTSGGVKDVERTSRATLSARVGAAIHAALTLAHPGGAHFACCSN